MKKFLTSRIFTFILGAVIFSGITGVAAYSILASDIGYTPKDSSWEVNNVKDAIDDLYTKSKNVKKISCLYISGTKGQIGSKYICDPGDGVARNFYILKVNTNNVEMIMESNLSDTVGNQVTMTWNDAIAFFTTGAGKDIKTSWENIESIDLPEAQTIANASNMTGWNVTTATSDNWSYFGTNSNSDSSKIGNYTWLYYNLRDNTYSSNDTSHARGYWTKDKVSNNDNYWEVYKGGWLGSDPIDRNDNNGVRPVITMKKSQLN